MLISRTMLNSSALCFKK